jgi:hypothetical protein
MVSKELAVDRPDGVILVVAYFLTVGAGLLFAGGVLLFGGLPSVLDLARGDSLFLGGAAVIVLLALASLLAGGWLIYTGRRLWQARPASRAAAAFAAALLIIVSLLAVPSFFIAYDRGPFLFGTVAAALLNGLASAAAFWYLARPHVKQHYS